MENSAERITNTHCKAKRHFYHLPPTAVPVAGGDIKYAFQALIDPAGSIQRFTSDLAERIGNANVFLTASGRLALLLILETLKIESPRREVIIPAYSCPTVVQAVLDAGLKPAFCDVSATNLDLDRDSLRYLLSSQTLAIIPTHLYGYAQDISDLLEIGQELGVFIVEDAAQAFGAQTEGGMAGNMGDFGFLSMGRGKCIPTGHGGIILTRDRYAPALANKISKLIPGRLRRDIPSIASFLAYGLATKPTTWWFIFRSPLNPAGAGMDRQRLPSIERKHPSPTQAGIGSSIVKRIDEINAVRRGNAELLRDLCSKYPFVTIPKKAPGSQPVYLRFPIILDNKTRSDQLYYALSQAGIGISKSYTRILPDIFARDNPVGSRKFPGADHLADCLLTLPTHSLGSDDIARIEACFTTIQSR